MPIEGPEAQTQKHRRAGRACLSCRARKVKCNVNQRQPCDNCRRDVTQCVVPRTRRSRKILHEFYRGQDAEDGPESSSQTVYCDAHDMRALPATSRGGVRETPEVIPDQSPLSGANEDEESHIFRHTPDDQSATQSTQLPPFIIPMSFVSPAYLHFLNSQKAFKLPCVTLQCQLLKAYIEFAYGRMPVVELDSLFRTLEHGDGSGGQISFLLYLAILFAGAAHAPSKVVEENGWASKKALRRDIYYRVQLLFDLGVEPDSLVEIQVALLLTSKSVHPGDKKGSWHWVNEAISRAFTLGLHKEASSTYNTSDRTLKRRIWWCCYVRDKIVALGLGQPTRIKSQDFSLEPLNFDDLENGMLETNRTLLGELQIGPLNHVEDQRSNELLIEKTKLTVIMEDVLSEMAGLTIIPAAPFAALDARLQLWLLNLPDSCRVQPAIPSYEDALSNIDISIEIRRRLLHMAFHTTIYTLHRPRCIPSSPQHTLKLPGSAAERETSGKAVLESARHITRLAADLHERKLDSNLPMTAITVICPAIFVHLLNMKSPVRTKREQAVLSFRVCMRIMERLRSLYSCTGTTINYLESVLRTASVAISNLPGMSISIHDIFRLNQRDQNDITAILGTKTTRPATRSSISSELAMGLNGLDGLLSEDAAVDEEMHTDAVGTFQGRNLTLPLNGLFWSPGMQEGNINERAGPGDENPNFDWGQGLDQPLFEGTLTPMGLDLNWDLSSDLFIRNDL